MRLTTAEQYLSLVDAEDRAFIHKLARARGHFTLTDYAKYRSCSRQAVYRRLQKNLGSLFKRLRPSAANSFPEIYFLTRKIACSLNPDYAEPKTTHTLLDGLLRSRLLSKEGGVWTHNTRQPSVLVSKNEIDVLDCLDRTVSSILQFAKNLEHEDKKLRIHCGLNQRVAAFEFLQKRVSKSAQDAQREEESLTWDALFSEDKHKTLASVKQKNIAIEVIYHEMPAFQFSEVC